MLSADGAHWSLGLLEARRGDAVAGLLGPGNVDEELFDVGIACTGAEERAEVPFLEAEEAWADLAVGGDAEAAAGAAEGLGDGCDDADAAGRAVGEGVDH